MRELVGVIRRLSQPCSEEESLWLHNRFYEILKNNKSLPEFSHLFWVELVHLCFFSNITEIGSAIAELLISNDLYVDRLKKALDLVRRGETMKAAYVARGPVAYNKSYAEVSKHSVPSTVLDQMAAMPLTARVLDLGCGTGLIGAACRSAGYAGHLVGLDLVEEMVAAVPADTYDTLVVADAFAWMAGSKDKWDAVVSFGVFVHFDEKASAAMISLVANSLNENGVFAFNASEKKEPFIHALPTATAAALIEQSGLDFEAIVRGEERTTFVCRKL